MTTQDYSLQLSCWRIDAGGTTAVFASFSSGAPALAYFGPALSAAEDLDNIGRLTIPNVGGGQLDPFNPQTLMPTSMTGWQGHPGLILLDRHGVSVQPDLKLKDVEAGDAEISFTFGNDGFVVLTLVARLDDAGLMHMRTSASPLMDYKVSWLCAGAIPVPDDLTRIQDHSGRWIGEFFAQETHFQTGQYIRESREGRTGHAHFPGITFLADTCSETSGKCLGATLKWSGGHKLIAEELPDGRRQLLFSVLDDDAHERPVFMPELVLAWSESGLNGLSKAFYTVPRAAQAGRKPKSPARPVHYNCWEAVYFRHSVEELKQIADRAADLGAERFVLDDGWFKGRNGDDSSLGDWVVDREKYPDGLKPLIDHIQSLGMTFGIWFEPEMINKQSDLYDAHPEWVQGPAAQPSGRNQYVLDLSRPEVCDYLFSMISDILGKYPVDYVKWDHNRILTGGKPAQTVALYRLFSKLNEAFPEVDFESCASGGGRIDYGILEYTSRVWLSDSNDAVERLRMQHEASRWVPPEIQGSHVGPRECHTSRRVLPMGFRAWVAAQRHMGFEMDPRELTDEEAETLKKATSWYRANRDFMFSADLYRLESNDEQVVAESYVSVDQSRFVMFRGQLGASRQIVARRICLTGLDPKALYEIRIVNPEDIAMSLNYGQANGLMQGETVTLSGQALMQGALRTPNSVPQTMMVFEGQKIS